LTCFSPKLTQFNTNRRAHTLEKRSIGLKIRPLVHQTPEMINYLKYFLFITKIF
jgi:hypothetical protein